MKRKPKQKEKCLSLTLKEIEMENPDDKKRMISNCYEEDRKASSS